MPYFSRLTDIVTCNISSLLGRSDHPDEALDEIIAEMTEGTAGAERSVRSAIANVERIETEIGTQRQEVIAWKERARESLLKNEEGQARMALIRKHEVEDLIAGLEQQLQAAMSTRDHLQTMLNALLARLSEARRRRQAYLEGNVTAALAVSSPVSSGSAATSVTPNRIDAELEELRRQCRGE